MAKIERRRRGKLRPRSANSRLRFMRASNPSRNADGPIERPTRHDAQLTEQQARGSAFFCRDRLGELTSYRPAAGGPLATRSARRSWWAGDDVTLRGVTAGDAGSTETDSLSVARQRSDGVEQAVASHSDT